MREDRGPIVASIDLLREAEVDFVLVGGAAALLHGGSFATLDVDFCCARDRENVQRIAVALNSVNPRFRVMGIPEGVPTAVDARTLHAGDAFSFITDLGNLDIRFDVDGIGSYARVLALSEEVQLDGETFRVLSLDGLIQSKAFLSRERDLAALPELRLMREAAQTMKASAAPEMPEPDRGGSQEPPANA